MICRVLCASSVLCRCPWSAHLDLFGLAVLHGDARAYHMYLSRRAYRVIRRIHVIRQLFAAKAQLSYIPGKQHCTHISLGIMEYSTGIVHFSSEVIIRLALTGPQQLQL